MRLILFLICSATLIGCRSVYEHTVTPLPSNSDYSGSVVPLSPDAHIDSSVSPTEVEYFQKTLANERDGRNAPIDGIYKSELKDGEVI